MGQLIQVGYGKANLSDRLATFASMLVKAPFKRESAVTSGRRNPGSRPNSSSVGRYDLNGGITVYPVEHEQGAIIMLRSTWEKRRVRLRDGAIFVKLRPTAALIEVAVALPLGDDNVLGSHCVIFQGNADLLSYDDLLDENIDPGRQFVERFMDVTEVEECFAVRQLVDEVAPRPQLGTVFTAAGATKAVVAEAPRRRMIFRR